MKDPMSRKLFKSRDAREKLRGMGGIMASSPELAQTVARFNNGGMIDEFSGLPPSMTAPVTVPVVPAMPTAGLQLTPEQERILMELGVTPEMAARLSPEELAAILEFEDPTQATRESFQDYPQPGPVPEPMNPITEYVGDVLGFEAPREARAERAAAIAERDAQRAASAAATERAILPQMEREMRDRAAQEERAVAAEQVAETEAQRRAAEELARVNEEAGDDEGFNFDTTYEQMLERVGRVMGEGAKKDDREKAMANLAMIGLAIAAGQSPDALTNIAQGALSGMQAIRAQEAREEDLAREARLTALEMTEGAADRASRERVAMMRASGDPRVSTYQDPFRDYAVVRDEALQAAMAGNAPDILEGESPVEYADRIGRAAVAAAQVPFTAGADQTDLAAMRAAEDQARANGQTEFTFGGMRYPVRPAS